MYKAIIFLLFLLSAAAAVFSQDQQSLPRRYIAFTFDDLPSTQGNPSYVIENLTLTLKKYGVPSIGFVNESKLYTDDKPDPAKIALMEKWLDTGLELGNHSYSHIYIDQVKLSEYETDILKGEKITKQLLLKRGHKLRYYRHTQLRTGPTPEAKKELEKFLRENGYTVAPVTMDNNDYVFASIYAKAKAKNDTSMLHFIRTEFLNYMETISEHFENLSREFLGYEVKQTLLLHASELNADHLPGLIEMFKKRNYEFISLEEALKDPAYQLEEAQSKKGISWLHRWMLAKGIAIKQEPFESKKISELFKMYK